MERISLSDYITKSTNDPIARLWLEILPSNIPQHIKTAESLLASMKKTVDLQIGTVEWAFTNDKLCVTAEDKTHCLQEDSQFTTYAPLIRKLLLKDDNTKYLAASAGSDEKKSRDKFIKTIADKLTEISVVFPGDADGLKRYKFLVVDRKFQAVIRLRWKNYPEVLGEGFQTRYPNVEYAHFISCHMTGASGYFPEVLGQLQIDGWHAETSEEDITTILHAFSNDDLHMLVRSKQPENEIPEWKEFEFHDGVEVNSDAKFVYAKNGASRVLASNDLELSAPFLGTELTYKHLLFDARKQETIYHILSFIARSKQIDTLTLKTSKQKHFDAYGKYFVINPKGIFNDVFFNCEVGDGKPSQKLDLVRQTEFVKLDHCPDKLALFAEIDHLSMVVDKNEDATQVVKNIMERNDLKSIDIHTANAAFYDPSFVSKAVENRVRITDKYTEILCGQTPANPTGDSNELKLSRLEFFFYDFVDDYSIYKIQAIPTNLQSYYFFFEKRTSPTFLEAFAGKLTELKDAVELEFSGDFDELFAHASEKKLKFSHSVKEIRLTINIHANAKAFTYVKDAFPNLAKLILRVPPQHRQSLMGMFYTALAPSGWAPYTLDDDIGVFSKDKDTTVPEDPPSLRDQFNELVKTGTSDMKNLKV